MSGKSKRGGKIPTVDEIKAAVLADLLGGPGPNLSRTFNIAERLKIGTGPDPYGPPEEGPVPLYLDVVTDPNSMERVFPYCALRMGRAEGDPNKSQKPPLAMWRSLQEAQIMLAANSDGPKLVNQLLAAFERDAISEPQKVAIQDAKDFLELWAELNKPREKEPVEAPPSPIADPASALVLPFKH